jgi:hypothetical protein
MAVRNCAMGDDCVEDVFDYSKRDISALERAYAWLGMPIKEAEVGTFEFCAYRYVNGVAVEPARAQRLFLNFLYHWPAERDFAERFADLMNELRHSPLSDKYLGAITWYHLSLD